jgi:PhzF family phenazine biosynthesis protein
MPPSATTVAVLRRLPCEDGPVIDVDVVTVFADGPDGGNPAPVVLDARRLTDDQMQAVARSYGHESAFVVDPSGTGCELALRFWVPNHEMEMCGHATLGTVWLLNRNRNLSQGGEVTVHTASGVVHARIAGDEAVQISQPAGHSETVQESDAVLEVLGLTRADLTDLPIRNAATSRTKTLVPLRNVERLDAIQADLDRVEAVCALIGSTGLYPFAASGDRQMDARQFPRSSGYPEDPATGIAATALAFGLIADGIIAADELPIIVRQGRAMGRPSRISVHLDIAAGQIRGCWLGGSVTFNERSEI